MIDRETIFKALVLTGIWMLARLIAHRDLGCARDWRANAIGYMDEIGQQTDAAHEYRRNVSFPEMT